LAEPRVNGDTASVTAAINSPNVACFDSRKAIIIISFALGLTLFAIGSACFRADLFAKSEQWSCQRPTE
jgi:hypothetical protein